MASNVGGIGAEDDLDEIDAKVVEIQKAAGVVLLAVFICIWACGCSVGTAVINMLRKYARNERMF